MVKAENSMNCLMSQVVVTFRDGKVANLENIYINGSKMCIVILPDMLRNNPKMKNMGRGLGTQNTGVAGRGRSAALRAQGARGRGVSAFYRGGGRGRGRASY